MSRKTLAATALLSCALVMPTAPAVASQSAPQQGTGTQHCCDDRDRRHHHSRGFAIAGVIENIDSRGEIRVDARRGPDRFVEIRRFTKIWRNGDRVSLSALREGDRVFARGFVRHGDRFAVFLVARG